jgi:hypothetical protein
MSVVTGEHKVAGKLISRPEFIWRIPRLLRQLSAWFSDEILSVAICSFVLGCAGCAQFQYSIVEPPALSQTIGRETVRIPYDPMEYRIAEVDDRLAVQITNPTDKAVTLSNSKSYLVDPKGASHGLTGGTIGPRSYVELTLPPAPMILRSGPSFGLGFGFGHYPYSRWHHRRSRFGLGMGLAYDYPPYYDPFYESAPRYYRVLTPEHWEWATGDVRLHLNYERPDQTFEHDFLLRRTRVK